MIKLNFQNKFIFKNNKNFRKRGRRRGGGAIYVNFKFGEKDTKTQDQNDLLSIK
jgi:hypothetical protein